MNKKPKPIKTYGTVRLGTGKFEGKRTCADFLKSELKGEELAKEILKEFDYPMNNKENNCQECQFEERNGHALTCSHRGEGEEKIEYGYPPRTQENKAEWEEEFDTKIKQYVTGHGYDTKKEQNGWWYNEEDLDIEALKDFISQELAQERKAAQEEVIEKIRKSSIWQLVPDTPRMMMCKDSDLDLLLKKLSV